MPLGQFLQERVFTPLGMTDSGVHRAEGKGRSPGAAFRDRPATNTPINLLDVTVPQKNDAGGAGSVGAGVGLRPLPADDDQRRPARRRAPAEPHHRPVHDRGPPGPTSNSRARRRCRPGTGFGLGFAVRKETGQFEVTGNAGEYYWAGAAGTGFYVDPKEDLICVWMTQATARHGAALRSLSLQADGVSGDRGMKVRGCRYGRAF